MRGSNIALISAAGLFVFSACGKEASQQQGGFAVRVVTAVAEREDLLVKIPVVGTLAANESADIVTEIDGRVEGIEFSEGDVVERGRVLFRVDENKLRARFNKAEAAFKLSKATYERQRETFEQDVISKQEFENALARYEADKADLEFARLALEDAVVRAPFDGVVGARLVSPRQVVQKGDKLASIVDPDPIKVEFQVPERFAGELKPGQETRLTVATFPGEIFRGKTFFVSPEVDARNRTVFVKAAVPNAARRLQPGMFANLDLIVGVRKGAATVPEIALMRMGEAESVFIVDAERKAQVRSVTIGLRLKGKVEVLTGVKPGERVVTEGLQKVRPGAPLAFDDEATPEKRS